MFRQYLKSMTIYNVIVMLILYGNKEVIKKF